MPPPSGPGVLETRRLLADHAGALRALAHWTAGWLPLVPRLDDKCVLAAHLHEDVHGAAALDARRRELAGEGPEDEPVTALRSGAEPAAGATSAAAYLEIAYGQVKPALARALRSDSERIDPIVDEPTLRLLTDLLHRQELHAGELPRAGLAGVAPAGREPAEVLPPAIRPAREPFVREAEAGAACGGGGEIHALLHSELCRAEVIARCSHENTRMPWEFHAAMARRCWDHCRHVAALDRHMTLTTQERWGAEPVDLADYTALYEHDLAGRLAAPAAELPPGLPRPLAEHIRANRRGHEREAVRWSGWEPSQAGRAS